MRAVQRMPFYVAMQAVGGAFGGPRDAAPGILFSLTVFDLPDCLTYSENPLYFLYNGSLLVHD